MRTLVVEIKLQDGTDPYAATQAALEAVWGIPGYYIATAEVR